MSGGILSTLHTFFPLILTTNERSAIIISLKNEEPEVLRGQMTCPSSHSQKEKEPGWKLRGLDSRMCMINNRAEQSIICAACHVSAFTISFASQQDLGKINAVSSTQQYKTSWLPPQISNISSSPLHRCPSLIFLPLDTCLNHDTASPDTVPLIASDLPHRS